MAVSEVHDRFHTATDAPARASPLLWFLLLFVCFAITSGYELPQEELADAGQAANSIAETGGSGLGRARPLALLALGAIGCLALLRGSFSVVPRGLLGLAIMAFVAYAAMSFLWAYDPGTVMRRTVVLLLLLAAVAGTARLFSLADLRAFVCVAFGLAVAIGLGTELMLGQFNPLAPGYRFQGLVDANSQGLIIAILILAVMAGRADRRRWLRFGAIAGLFVLLTLTGSRGALGALIAGFIVWQFASGRGTALALRGALALSLLLPLAFLVAGGELGSSAQDAVLLGREDQGAGDPTSLTGRVPLWAVLIEHYVSERPLLGYGFQGFWTPRHIVEVSAYQDWAILFAHSSYVDMLLALGFLGLIIYVFILSGALLRSVRRARGEGSAEWAFAAAVLAAIILNSFLETVLLAPNLQSFVGLVIILKAATLQPAGASPRAVA